MTRSLHTHDHDHDRLRADLAAAAARHDSSTSVPGGGSPLPAVYTLTEPGGPGQPITLHPQPLDHDLWRQAGEAWLVLIALAAAIATSGGVPDLYGYALAYHAHPADPRDDPNTTPCVILALGRDGNVFLAGTGNPGPQYELIAYGLDQMVLAARYPTARRRPDQTDQQR